MGKKRRRNISNRKAMKLNREDKEKGEEMCYTKRSRGEGSDERCYTHDIKRRGQKVIHEENSSRVGEGMYGKKKQQGGFEGNKNECST